jgi:hypothetical protein
MIKMLNKLLSIFEIADKITVEFIYTPSYSPKLNLAEYLIHLREHPTFDKIVRQQGNH